MKISPTADYILSPQTTLYGQPEVVGFGSGGLTLEQIPKAQADEVIRQGHYSGTVCWSSNEHLGFHLYGALIAVLQFGPAMNPASGAKIVADTEPDGWTELNRMWIADTAPDNCASMAISYAVKYLRRARPSVEWVQAFADERCRKLGAVYQACSFLYCGRHEGEFYELDGTYYHRSMMGRKPRDSRGWGSGPRVAHLNENAERAKRVSFWQYRYIRPLTKRARSGLLLPVLPYPKPSAHNRTRRVEGPNHV